MDGMHQCAYLAASAALHLLLPVRDCDGRAGDRAAAWQPVVGDGGRHFASGGAVRQALDNATVTRADIGQRAERRQAKRCLAQHPLCILVGVAPIAG